MRRTIRELVDAADDAWPEVVAWVDESVVPTTIEPADGRSGEVTLLSLQVSTRSPMGAIALRSGGILVDSGWLRILGAGGGRIGDGLREWNALEGAAPLAPPLDRMMVVGYDAVGGFFVLNGGGLPGEIGHVHYLAPDTYDPLDLETGYSGFIRFALSDAFHPFVADLRWPGWEREVSALGRDRVLSMYPPLGFEAVPLATRSRRPVPAREAWSWYWDIRLQLGGIADGSAVRLEVVD